MVSKYSGKRIFYLDELRAIAILCVILCHTTRVYSPYVFDNIKVALPGLINVIGLVGVPLFFMLSGALLFNRDYELGDFFKKRFSRILYPAIFWILITSLICYPLFGQTEVVKIIFGDSRYTWFVWMMIGLYLITPVMNSFVKEYGMKGVKYFIIIWFITIILNTFNMLPLGELELSYFAGDIGYFFLGYYLVNHEFKLSSLSQCLLGAILFIIFTVINMYLRYHSVHVNCGYESIFVALAGLGVFLLIKGLSSYFENRKPKTHSKIRDGSLGNLIFWISACSYGMYFVNSLIFKLMSKLDITSLKLFPVLFIGVSVLSLAIVYAMSKINFLKKFSGAA